MLLDTYCGITDTLGADCDSVEFDDNDDIEECHDDNVDVDWASVVVVELCTVDGGVVEIVPASHHSVRFPSITETCFEDIVFLCTILLIFTSS